MEPNQGCVVLGRMSIELVKYQRRLTERKNIDEQGTRSGLSRFDYPVIGILGFITISHG